MDKPTLIYVYDPLCLWCFGFYPVMEKLQNRFGDKLNLDVKTGGLVIGEQAHSIEDDYEHILRDIKQVEKITDAKFGRNFKLLAEEGSYRFDSLTPCKAQKTIKKLLPNESLRFAGELQQTLFVEGKSLNKWETYKSLLDHFEVNPTEFKQQLESDSLEEELFNEFKWCRENGAGNFPTLMLQVGKEHSVMSRGYRPFDTIESHLHHLLKNLERIS